MRRLEAEPMKQHTTWKIGGPAEVLLQPESVAEVKEALALAKASGKPWFILGLGSNLLVRDEGIPGIVIELGGRLKGLDIRGTRIVAEAGIPLPALAFQAAEAGLDGLTFAAGIPGSLGGALVMNAGAYGGQISDVVESVDCITPAGETVTLPKNECGFAYRTSRFKQESGWVILSATLQLAEGDASAMLEVMRQHNTARREKQPLEYPNAGSIFQNPAGDAAGRLVEAAGAKGMRVGDAMVSEKHANFIVNLGNATCNDVLTLIHRVQQAVEEASGIHLQTEVLLIP